MSDLNRNDDLPVTETEASDLSATELEASDLPVSETEASEQPDVGKDARGPRDEHTYDGREMFSFAIRGIAGAYVIYLAYQIMRDMIKKGEIRWLMVAACALFVVFGVFFIYLSLRYLSGLRRHNLEEAAEHEREATDPEYAAMKAKERAERGESEPAAPARRGLFGGAAAAVQQQPRSLTGSDIRDRLRQINEADGLEIDEISGDEDELADTEDDLGLDELADTEVDLGLEELADAEDDLGLDEFTDDEDDFDEPADDEDEDLNAIGILEGEEDGLF